MINFRPSLVYPFFRIIDTPLTVGIGATVSVIPNSPERVYWRLTCFGPQALTIRPLVAPAANTGIIVNVNATVEMGLADKGILAQCEWIGSSGAGASAIWLLQVIYDPQSE